MKTKLFRINKLSKTVPRSSFDLKRASEWSHNWHGLIKFMLKWLKRWNVLDPFTSENIVYYRFTQTQADSLTKAITLQANDIARHLNTNADDMVVIVGENQFRELMRDKQTWFNFNRDPEPGQAFLSNIQFGQLFDNGVQEITTIHGIPVVVVPWFDGYVVVPRKSLLVQEKAEKNVRQIREPYDNTGRRTSLLGG